MIISRIHYTATVLLPVLTIMVDELVHIHHAFFLTIFCFSDMGCLGGYIDLTVL